MINKIVYFTLTSTAETPMGIVIRKAGLPLFFPFFYFFHLPLLARLATLWWSCGSSEGYHPNTEQHWKSKLWLVSRDRRVAAVAPGVCVCSGVLSHPVAKKVEWNLFSDVYLTVERLPTFFCACWSKCLFYWENAGSFQTSVGPTNQWLNPCFVCMVE